MSERNNWLLIGGISLGFAASFGALIHLKGEEIQKDKDEIVQLDGEIAGAVALLEGTQPLEEEVILQRETDEVVATILPNGQDIAELVSALQQFESASDVNITDLKPAATPQSSRSDFDKVVYSLQLSGDAFEVLSFLDLVESHDRFMSVPRFRLTTTRHSPTDSVEGVPRHEVRLDVETYVYEPKGGAQAVQIDNYEAKRNRLQGEILRRRDELAFAHYEYGGRRGRRDPWVDPRVLVNRNPDDEIWTIEQQIAYVETMIDNVENGEQLMQEMLDAESFVENAKLSRDLQDALAFVEGEVRRMDAVGVLSFHNAKQRFDEHVVEACGDLRAQLLAIEDVRGPSVEELAAQIASMERHLLLGEYLLAMELFHEIEGGLTFAEADLERADHAHRLRELYHFSETFRDFDEMEILISGVLIHGGLARAAIINGRTLQVGEYLDGGLLVQSIERDAVEFIYRDILFTKAVNY